MKIAVLGMGGIGSTFALHLAREGHNVTAIARGKRLEQLQADRAIVTTSGERVPCEAASELDVAVPYDLILVTVLAHQLDAVLPALSQSAAKQIMFAFNLFEPLTRLRDAVGKERFIFGFPAIMASIEGGRLKSSVVTRGPQKTLSMSQEWADTFTSVGIPTDVPEDIESWLHTHAAFVAPFMATLVIAQRRQAGIAWAQAKLLGAAMRDGMHIVRKLGYPLTPRVIGWFGQRATLVASLLWLVSRIPGARQSGAIHPGEPRALLDAMVAVAPDLSAGLLQVRRALD
jgi:2-dehydropantoate 2-reductase